MRMKTGKSNTWRRTFHAALLVFVTMILAGPAFADEAPSALRGAEVIGGPVTPTVAHIDIFNTDPIPRWHPGDPVKEIPRRFFGGEKEPANPGSGLPDALVDVQRSAGLNEDRGFTTPLLNVDGQGYTGVSPPDTVGDVGPNYYIQAINDSGGAKVQIFDKNGNTVGSDFMMDSLGSGACGDGLGDPIVLYDRLAQRWLLQEFSNSGNYMCFYISQTADPTQGTWYAYSFQTPNFPDYPHIGVWPDAYYTTSNEENGGAVYAFDRENMLTGAAARAAQRFTLSSLNGYGFQVGTPADLDGPDAPPAGTPGYIMRHVDDEAHSNYPDDAVHDLLEIYAFSVDWTTPANSTFTQLPDIQITDYNSWFTDYSTFYSVPQPGTTTRLDPIREVILNRLSYWNFGDHQTLLGVFPTNIDVATSGNTVNAGQRWFELRKTGTGDWSLYQEGTYQPGDSSENRFVGSIAMDQSGNMALGYSFTDTDPAVYPSIHFTGRLSTAALNSMDQPETILVTGDDAGGGRWGDYSAMSVDPADDCTFWYTTEYISGSWTTRIASFKFDQCGCLLSLDTPTAQISVPGDNNIRLQWNDSTVPEITQYKVYRATTAGGPYSLMTNIADSSPGSGGGSGYSWDDTSVSGGTTYYYIVRSSDGGSCLSDPSNEVSATATGTCTLGPNFGGATGATSAGTSDCAIDVSWDSATSQCGSGNVVYNVYRGETSGFLPSVSNMVAEGVHGTTYRDTDSITFATTYYYIVQAIDLSNGRSDGNLVEVPGLAAGPGSGVTDHPSTDTPIDIPDDDPTGITSNLTIADSSPIADINVSIDITHTYQGDLHVVLTSPSGTSVTLHDGTGSSEDNIQTTYDSLTAPDGPGSMADFDGENAQGTWTLFIYDDAGYDTGTLNSWTLHIEQYAACSTGEPPLFSDDFESGNSSAWTWTFPSP